MYRARAIRPAGCASTPAALTCSIAAGAKALRTISDGQLTGCHLDELQVVQNLMAGDAAVLPGEPAHSDANGADAARGLAMP